MIIGKKASSPVGYIKNREAVIEALFFSRFFLASDAASLAEICEIFFAPQETYIEAMARPPQIDWRIEEYTFNKLFVGPAEPIAPPYASVWLGLEKMLMTEHTLAVRQFYEDIGFTAPKGVPDDHIGLELEAYVILQFMLTTTQDTRDEGQATEAIHEALHWFIHEHWQAWLPLFVERLVSTPQLSPVIRLVIARFQRWMTGVFSCPDAIF